MFSRVSTVRPLSATKLSSQIIRIQAQLQCMPCRNGGNTQRSVHDGLTAGGATGCCGQHQWTSSPSLDRATARKDTHFRRYKLKSPMIHNTSRRSISYMRFASEKKVHPGEIRTSMLAWQIHNYGKDNFQLVEKPVPIITRPDELLIKVYASSLNPIDLRMQEGYGAVLLNKARKCSKSGDEFPLVLGRDCSGVVVDVGKGVKGIRKGDEVWAAVNQIKPGSHAQYVLANHNEVSKKPTNLTHVEAASLPYAIATVWSALYAIARFRPNENAIGRSVLIHAGSGGIGSFAIQLVKAWNGRVTATCSTDAVDMVKKLGASTVYDYKLSNFEESLMKTGGFDLILDTVGGATEDLSMKLLKSGSQLISLVSPFMADMDRYGAFVGSLSASTAMFRKAMAASKQGGKYRWAFANPNAYSLETVAKLVEEGVIKPVIDRVYTFSEVPEAFEKLRKGHARGKIVIDMGEEKPDQPTSADFYMDAAKE